jgi:membrane-associated phospholipid phosphatase
MHDSTFAPTRPPTPRSSYLLPAGCCAAALAAFALLVVEAAADRPAAWDAHVSNSLYGLKHRHTFVGAHAHVLVWFLGPAAEVLAIAALLAVLVLLVRRRRFRDAAFIVAAVAGTFLLEPILKDLIKRPPFRPPDSGYSFPSGHAMRSAAALSAVAITAWPSRWRWLVTIASAFLCGAVGVGLVYDGWHWASDVVGGWCVTLGWVSILLVAMRANPRRPATRPPAER